MGTLSCKSVKQQAIALVVRQFYRMRTPPQRIRARQGLTSTASWGRRALHQWEASST